MLQIDRDPALREMLHEARVARVDREPVSRTDRGPTELAVGLHKETAAPHLNDQADHRVRLVAKIVRIGQIVPAAVVQRQSVAVVIDLREIDDKAVFSTCQTIETLASGTPLPIAGRIGPDSAMSQGRVTEWRIEAIGRRTGARIRPTIEEMLAATEKTPLAIERPIDVTVHPTGAGMCPIIEATDSMTVATLCATKRVTGATCFLSSGEDDIR